MKLGSACRAGENHDKKGLSSWNILLLLFRKLLFTKRSNSDRENFGTKKKIWQTLLSGKNFFKSGLGKRASQQTNWNLYQQNKILKED